MDSPKHDTSHTSVTQDQDALDILMSAWHKATRKITRDNLLNAAKAMKQAIAEGFETLDKCVNLIKTACPNLKYSKEDIKEALFILTGKKEEPQEKQGDKIKVFTIAELLKKEFAELVFYVLGLIVEGITLLSGNPKAGKTRLAIGFAIALSIGGLALGKIPVEKISILFLALEGGEKRFQKTLKDMNAFEVDNFYYRTDWPQGHEGIKALNLFCAQHPEVKLIIIDTWARFAGLEDYSDYAATVSAMTGFSFLAEKYGVSFLLIHHTRKQIAEDFVLSSLGSTGIPGSVDTILVLKRDRGTSRAKLLITGRDLEDSELILEWDRELNGWALLGNAEEVQTTPERQCIYEILEQYGALSPIEVWEKLHELGDRRKPESIRYLLFKMKNDGKVITSMGKYQILKDINNNNINTPNSNKQPNGTNDANSPNGVNSERLGVGFVGGFAGGDNGKNSLFPTETEDSDDENIPF